MSAGLSRPPDKLAGGADSTSVLIHALAVGFRVSEQVGLMNMTTSVYFIVPTEKTLCLPETSFPSLLAREQRAYVGPQILQTAGTDWNISQKPAQPVWKRREH